MYVAFTTNVKRCYGGYMSITLTVGLVMTAYHAAAVAPAMLCQRPLTPIGGVVRPVACATDPGTPASLVDASVELRWTDTASDAVSINRAVGTCRAGLRFSRIAVLAAGATPDYVDHSVTPGDVYCYQLNTSNMETVAVPPMGVPGPPTPRPPRFHVKHSSRFLTSPHVSSPCSSLSEESV